MGKSTRTTLNPWALGSLGCVLVACSSFDGDMASSGGGGDDGGPTTSSSSGSPADGGSTSSGSSTSSSSGNTEHDSGACAPPTACSTGVVFCDLFDRKAPVETGAGWAGFGMVPEPNYFKIETPPGQPCEGTFYAYVGEANSGLPARMLERTVNAPSWQHVTVELDLAVQTILAEFTDGRTFLVALSPAYPLTEKSSYYAILAQKDSLAIGGQSSPGNLQTAPFSTTNGQVSHLTWKVDTTTGATSLAIGGIAVIPSVGFPKMFPSPAPTQIHVYMGVASTSHAQAIAARIDNFQMSAQ